MKDNQNRKNNKFVNDNQNSSIKDTKETKQNSGIFDKKTNLNYKLIPFNHVENDIGKMKYLPPVSKEWKNTIYSYSNTDNIKNLPIYDLTIYSLIKGYFSLYFNNKFLFSKYISRKKNVDLSVEYL